MIEKLRNEIDELDRSILVLLNRRAALSSRIALEKRARGMPPVCPEREREILDALVAKNPGPLDGGDVERIFTAAIEGSRRAARRAPLSPVGAGRAS